MQFNRQAFLSKIRSISDRLRDFSKTRKARNLGIIILIFLFLFSITGFFILPPYVKRVAVEVLSEQLGRTVNIGAVSLNPYSLGVTIKDFEIREEDGATPFVSFAKLYVNLQLMSVFRGGPVIKEVKLEKPRIHLVRTSANTYNFTDIVERIQARSKNEPKDKPQKPFFYSFSNIQVLDGALEFDDHPARTRHEITQVNFGIPFISNLPSYVEAYVQPSLSAVINGTPLDLKGASKVFSDSRETSFDLLLKDIDIPYYLAYVPAEVKVSVPSGRLDIAIKIIYRQYKDRLPTLILQGETTLRGLRAVIKKIPGDFLNIPLLSVRDISFDLQARKIEVGSIATEKGFLAVSRGADGRMNFDSIVDTTRTSPSPETKKAEPAPSWSVLLKSLVISDYTVKATDGSLRSPSALTVDEITLKTQDLSTDEKDNKGNVAFSMRVDRKGTVSIGGDVKLKPLAADLTVNIKGVPLKPAQPFLAERARAILAGGSLNMNGALTAAQNKKDGINTSFKGKLWINKLSLLDQANAEDLLKWESLYIGEMDIRSLPLFVHIREIALTNFYSRIIINADKTVNLREVFSAPTGTTPEPPAPLQTVQQASAPEDLKKSESERKIRIDKITVQGGTINFTDESIKPRFSSNLLEIGGRISGLTSEEGKLGELELRGKYDRYAPLEIVGKLNPLGKDLFVDVKADFKDMDLTQVSPYAGKYAGYGIQKGKLSFHLEYLVEKNKLDSKNNIFIDQFTFGDPVSSPDATKLPVKLAVSLLKNRNGEIALDIPVSGELNDPKFSIGRVVLKVLMNLLEKAATSPFALLGAAFGGGEQLGYAEFASGSTDLTDATKKKLDILSKALYDRPALKMDVVGHADLDKDREGLKQNLMLRKVKAQKVKDLSRKAGESASIETVTVTPEEYPEYLKRVYREEKFPKPRNIIGLAKDLPVSEMEKLIVTNTKVSDDDLRALAGDRARAIRDYLVQSKKTEMERIFIVEAKTITPEKKEGVKDSRTDFILK